MKARPDLAIMRLKQTTAASRAVVMDDETKRYVNDMTSVLAWLDHLESERREADQMKEQEAQALRVVRAVDGEPDGH